MVHAKFYLKKPKIFSEPMRQIEIVRNPGFAAALYSDRHSAPNPKSRAPPLDKSESQLMSNLLALPNM